MNKRLLLLVGLAVCLSACLTVSKKNAIVATDVVESTDGVESTDVGSDRAGDAVETSTAGIDDVAEASLLEIATETSAPEPYGLLSGSFSTAFVLDGSRFFDEPAYKGAHEDDIVKIAAFTGTYASGKSIPNPAAVATHSYLLSDPPDGRPHLLQQSYAADGVSYPNPHVQFYFPAADLAVGDVAIGVSAGLARLYVFNYATDGSVCLLALGVGGTLRITEATNTGAAEGGSLTFEGDELPIYYPPEAPVDPNVLSDLAAKMPTCERE